MNFNSTKNVEDKGKKSKIVKILIAFCVFLLIMTYFVYSYYIKNNKQENLKKEFFSKFINNDFVFFLEDDLYTKISEKMQKQDYDSSSHIKLSTTMQNNMFSQLDLSKFEISHELMKKFSENRRYNKISTNYAGNHVLTVDCISNNQQFAIKSDEIVNKYVGINQANLQTVANQIANQDVDLLPLKKIKNFVVDRENIEFSNLLENPSLDSYVNLCINNISSSDFSKKENVIVTLDSEQVNCTEYTISLASDEMKQIINQLSEKLKQDDSLISNFVVSDVENFENDGIAEYSDNDNVSEISAREDNFNTSMEIWGEGHPVENTTANETASNNVSENVTQVPSTDNNINQVPTNTVLQDTTNTISNTISNENSGNTVEEQMQNQDVPNEETQNQEEQESSEQNENQGETQELTNSDSNYTSTVEEDNFRTQGFIEVNDENLYDDEEHFIIGENYEETIRNMVDYVENIDCWSYILTSAKANCTKEELVEKLQKILLDRINNSLIIKMYVSNDKVIKLNFQIPETQESLDVEVISKGEKEKYLNVILLKGDTNEANGYHLNLYKKNSDSNLKNKIMVNKIYKGKISQKMNVNVETKGNSNSKKYITSIEIRHSDSDGEFKTEIENELNFDVNAEIEELNDENCLFIDTLSNEELTLTMDTIKEKIISVLKEKNRNLNMMDVNSSVVEQIEGTNNSSQDLAQKEEAKKVLIQTIADKMRDYLNEGTELKIQDLEGLEIPNYEVSISISSNLAIITVNGYQFKLDSEFHLSD